MEVERAKRVRIFENTPNITLKENEYEGKYEITADYKKNKAEVTKYLTSLKDKEFHNKDINGAIKLSSRDIDEITQFGMNNPLYLKLIAHIPTLIEKSVFIVNQPPKKPNHHYSRYNQLAIGAIVNKKPIVIRSVLEEENGNWYYSFFITEKSKEEILAELRRPNAVPQGTTSLSIKDTTLADILQAPNSSPLSHTSGEKSSNFFENADNAL